MPLDLDDQRLVDEAIADSQASNQLLIRDPAESQKLGRFDVMCTILNRTIGASFKEYPTKHHLFTLYIYDLVFS